MKHLLLLFIIFITISVQAQTTWMVDSLNDSGFGSLRAACDSAVANDTVRFNPALIANGSDSILLLSTISVTKNLYLIGLYNSSDTLFISGGGITSHFYFNNVNTIVLDSLVLVNGFDYSDGGSFRSNLVDSLVIKNCVVRNNSADGEGGAVYANRNGVVEIENSQIINNSANQDGGGIYSSGSTVKPSRIRISTCLISNNSSQRRGGGVFSYNYFLNNAEIKVISSEVSNNSSNFEGGGLFCATTSDSTSSLIFLDHAKILDNHAVGDGGGVYCAASISTVEVESSTIDGNTSNNRGGGICSSTALFHSSSSTATLSRIKVEKSTIANNSSGTTGGGLYSNATSSSYSRVVDSEIDIASSTIVDNAAGSLGGAIFSSCTRINCSSTIMIKNATVVGNNSGNQNGEIVSLASYSAPSIIDISGSIIAYNGAININNDNVYGFTSGGFNILSDSVISGAVSTDILNQDSVDINLGPLYNNGGGSETLIPIFPSVAINAGDPNDTMDAQNSNILGVRDIGAAESCVQMNIDIQRLCNVNSYTWINGVTYYSDNNTATFNNLNALGCGTVSYLDLKFNVPVAIIEVVEVCDSLVWRNGQTYFSSTNTPTDTILNANGCDTVVTLNLTVNYSTLLIDTIVTCDSLTWINGVTYYSNNNSATDTLINLLGCDTIVKLDLTINNTSFVDVQTACDSLTWINGVTYYSSNNSAKDTLVNVVGCDSVVFLDLTINHASSYIDSIISCDSLTWIDGITYYSSNNTATDTLVNVVGCDSIVTLNLTINNSTLFTDVITTCDSLTWIDGITYYSSNNTATDTLVNAVGCDSIVALNLTINNATFITDVITACDSLTWINGITYYSNNNIANDTLMSAAGCDSIVTLNLTIHNSTTFMDVITACDSLTWIDGITYFSSNNTATDTLVNAVGCDSIVYLDLTITNSSLFTDVITACDSLTWINGITYYGDTIDSYVMTNGVGCDSVITLDLTINQSSSGVDSVIAVNQYTWIDGVTYYAHNSTAIYTLTNAAGCDSLVYLYLEIQVVQIGVDQQGSTLTATADSGTFQWVECPNYDIIPGATDSVFNPTQNGSYAVIVTQNGYTDTSDCITVTNVGIGKVNLSNNINIYPNPVHDQVNIEITNWPTNGVAIVVRDITGKQVYTQKVESISNKETIQINTSKWAKGTYFIEVGGGEKRVVEKIVVQ